MKKFFLLSLVLISQTYSMELTRRHQTPTPVTMDQQTQTSIDEKKDAWNKRNSDMLSGLAGGSCAFAITYLTVCIPVAMGLSGTLSTGDLVYASGIYFGPPICCCALSACLYKKALKGMDKKKALLTLIPIG